MPTHNFTGPKVRCERKGKCPACGKRVLRSRTFEQTVNPFNRNANGVPKTWEEVFADVRAQADAWQPNFAHEGCR